MRVHVLGCLAALVVAGEAAAQTIQLPSFSAVGVNTTVVVPDSGGAFIARDRRYYQNFNTFGGFPRNRGWGIRRQMPGFGVTAQIHDPAAADQALLGRALDAAAPAADGTKGLRIGAGRAAGDAPTGSVAELRQRQAQQAAEQAAAAQREARTLLDKGRQAVSAGKGSVAAIYFRMAARQAQGALGDEIAAEIDALSGDRPLTARTGRRDP